MLRELRHSGLGPEGYETSRLDSLWTMRRAGTVYRSVTRSKLNEETRAYWEAEGTPAVASILMKETLGDVRLASLLDGAAAGHLRRFMEVRASSNFKAALHPTAIGALSGESLVPVGTWKELMTAIFDARIWAVHELFYGRAPWMGLSPDYRRRLRVGLALHFDFIKKCGEDGGDFLALSKMSLAKVDSVFGSKPHTLLGEDLPYHFMLKIGQLGDIVALVADGSDLEESARVPQYWTAKHVDPKMLPILRTVSRLVGAGRNRATRALLVAVNLKDGKLPARLRPVVPVDGPEPLAYLGSLEASKGWALSRLFDVDGAVNPQTVKMSATLGGMHPKDFDMGIFDPRIAEVAVVVPVDGLRAQWAWARKHPMLVGTGGILYYPELVLWRLGLAKAFPGSVEV